MDAIEQMRGDFRVIATKLLAYGWTESEISELGMDVKRTVDGGDVAQITALAGWLAGLSKRLAPEVGINTRIRAMIEEQRKVEYFKARQAA